MPDSQNGFNSPLVSLVKVSPLSILSYVACDNRIGNTASVDSDPFLGPKCMACTVEEPTTTPGYRPSVRRTSPALTATWFDFLRYIQSLTSRSTHLHEAIKDF